LTTGDFVVVVRHWAIIAAQIGNTEKAISYGMRHC